MSELPQVKPGLLQAFTILTLIDAIINLLLWIPAGLFLLCGTIVCAPLAAFPLVLGILELVQWGPLNRTPPGRRDIPVWLCVLQIINVIFMNPLSLAVGILGLVAGQDAHVKLYLAQGMPLLGVDFMRCRVCGFDLRGTIAAGGGICPECGTTSPIIEAASESIRAETARPPQIANDANASDA